MRTDQKSLKFLLEQRVIASEYQRWIAKLMGYDFNIEYKRGMENTTKDALSRLPPEMELGLLSIMEGLITAIFRDQIEADEELNGIHQAIIDRKTTAPGYSLREGLLHYKGRLVLPATSPMIPLLLTEFHNSTIGVIKEL